LNFVHKNVSIELTLQDKDYLEHLELIFFFWNNL